MIVPPRGSTDQIDGGLYFRVRDGYGCFPSSVVACNLTYTPYSYKGKETPRKTFYHILDKCKNMSGGLGQRTSLTEKLEHSTIIDILQIGVYAYFGYIAYSNLGYSKGDVLNVSMDPTVIAVQLAAFLVIINFGFIMHDKVSGSGHR